jgi:hypothetical protein
LNEDFCCECFSESPCVLLIGTRIFPRFFGDFYVPVHLIDTSLFGVSGRGCNSCENEGSHFLYLTFFHFFGGGFKTKKDKNKINENFKLLNSSTVKSSTCIPRKCQLFTYNI